MTTKDRAQLIIQQLAEAKAEDPNLAPFYEFHQTMLDLLNETQTSISDTLEIAHQETQETPLLSFEKLPIESQHFSDLAIKVGRVLKDYEPALKGQTLPDDANLWMTLAEKRFKAGCDPLVKKEEAGIEQKAALDLSELCADVALKPYLAWAAQQATSQIDQEHWKRGYCPVCGGLPDFATLDEESGARHLLCSRCNTRWLYRRLGCPFCETDDHTKLAYYLGQDGAYRLYVCEACHRYLKCIDLRKAGRRVMPEVERFTTVNMDVAAHQEGYL